MVAENSLKCVYKTIAVFFFIFFVPLVFAGSVSAATYYVSTTGSDTNPGTLSQPWKTIQKSSNTMVAGDTAYVRKGIYKENVNIRNSGVSGAYITYSAYPGEIPIVDATGLSSGFFIGNKKYVEIRGFEIINAYVSGVTSSGMRIGEGSQYITISGNNIHHNFNNGIAVSAGSARATNLLFEGNNIHNNGLAQSDQGSGHGIIFYFSGDGSTIRNNTLHENGGPYNGTTGLTDWASGIELNNTKSVLVEGNDIYGNEKYGVDLCGGTTGVTVMNNSIHHNYTAGISLNNASVGNVIVKNKIFENVQSNDWGAGIFITGDLGNNKIINNT
ncbi:MAG: right-handed parallel beta-helix repeat-containing protein, partial [Ignavibacteria bacterium]|nr:right-handed parallel beta-helix repeat-containing protein [Ignavibacteria bacterium]